MTDVLGYLGIVVSGLAAILFVTFAVASLWPQNRSKRGFAVPLAVIFFAAVVDRFVIGQALLSSATEIDLAAWERVLTSAARIVLIVGAAWLFVSSYKTLSSHKDEEP